MARGSLYDNTSKEDVSLQCEREIAAFEVLCHLYPPLREVIQQVELNCTEQLAILRHNVGISGLSMQEGARELYHAMLPHYRPLRRDLTWRRSRGTM